MAFVLFLAAVSNGANAGVQSGGRSDDGFSGFEDLHVLYLAGSGDNPWALPQTQNEKAQGPSYQVNPRYVTPEDVEADSLDEYGRRSRKHRNASSNDAPDSNIRRRQPASPYGPYYAPNYAFPGYGGYYGGFPGMGGLPGLGGYPLLYPYPYGGMDPGDPYNLLMQPYPAGSEDDGD